MDVYGNHLCLKYIHLYISFEKFKVMHLGAIGSGGRDRKQTGIVRWYP